MNAYDELSSKDCRTSPYDYLPFEERRTIARWRAATTAIAASAVLAIFGLLAMFSEGSGARVAEQATPTTAVAAPARDAPAAASRGAVPGTGHVGMLATSAGRVRQAQ